MSTKYRIRRCCSVCGDWQVWRFNRVMSTFPSGEAALFFFAHVRSVLKNARVQLEAERLQREH